MTLQKFRTMKRRPRFFKVLVGDFLERLWMPPAFVHDTVGELPSSVLLATNSPMSYSVQLSETDEGVYFGEGWKDFAECHKLQEEEFLVFTYHHDKKYFKVTIFAPSGLERGFIFEKVKPKEAKEKVEKSCTNGSFKTSNKSNSPLIRTNPMLEQEFVPDMAPHTTNESSNGMAYHGNLREQEAVQCRNCDSPAIAINDDNHIADRGDNDKIPSFCANEVPAAYYGSSSHMGDECTLKKRKVIQRENYSSPVIEVGDDDTIDDGVSENYRRRKSGSVVSSVQCNSFDFVIRKNRRGYMHGLNVPASFASEFLHGKSQVKIDFGDDQRGRTFSVGGKIVGNSQYINGMPWFYKHYNFKVGDKCRFEHVRGSEFKISKIRGKPAGL